MWELCSNVLLSRRMIRQGTEDLIMSVSPQWLRPHDRDHETRGLVSWSFGMKHLPFRKAFCSLGSCLVNWPLSTILLCWTSPSTLDNSNHDCLNTWVQILQPAHCAILVLPKYSQVEYKQASLTHCWLYNSAGAFSDNISKGTGWSGGAQINTHETCDITTCALPPSHWSIHEYRPLIGQNYTCASLLPSVSQVPGFPFITGSRHLAPGPIRGQYSGHVISSDQSETSNFPSPVRAFPWTPHSSVVSGFLWFLSFNFSLKKVKNT